MYTRPEIIRLITEKFVPARFHVKENAEGFARFGAEWTPTILIADAEGKERHRIEGFLPAGDFAAQIRLGLAHALREGGNFEEAEKLYRALSDESESDVAAESLYWAGVSRYKRTNDAGALNETAKAFQSRFSGSSWAKKSSVWL